MHETRDVAGVSRTKSSLYYNTATVHIILPDYNKVLVNLVLKLTL